MHKAKNLEAYIHSRWNKYIEIFCKESDIIMVKYSNGSIQALYLLNFPLNYKQ